MVQPSARRIFELESLGSQSSIRTAQIKSHDDKIVSCKRGMLCDDRKLNCGSSASAVRIVKYCAVSCIIQNVIGGEVSRPIGAGIKITGRQIRTNRLGR